MIVRAETLATRKIAGYLGALVSSLAGLGLSVELSRLHLIHEIDPTNESYCNVSKTINCDAVTTSDYSVFLGIPLSVWGICAYLAAAALALWGWRTRRPAPALGLVGLGIVSTVGALILAYISAFRIGAFCLLCMCSWVADLGLLAFAMVAAHQLGWREVCDDAFAYARANISKLALIGLGFLLLLGTLGRAFAPASQKTLDTGVQVPTATASSAASMQRSDELAMGTDASGHHYIGAKDPKLTITEFSDYQCPFCAKAHTTLRALARKYPHEIRIVHRHFPLDNDCNPTIKRPFHRHSCYYARLSVCAGLFEKFWQANDYLFEHGREESPIALETLARHLGLEAASLRECVSQRADALLKPDLDQGAQLNIEGTPTLLIDGKTYTGPLPSFVYERYPL